MRRVYGCAQEVANGVGHNLSHLENLVFLQRAHPQETRNPFLPVSGDAVEILSEAIFTRGPTSAKTLE